MTTRWTRRHLGLLSEDPATTAPLADPTGRVLLDDDVWDMWPIQEEDGSVAAIHGQELWMARAAPPRGHPEARHDVARIRLLSTDGRRWTDRGPVFDDGASLGSREWSGSAVRRADGTVSVFYTAAGLRGEAHPTFVQRVVEARLGTHREIVRPDERWYLPADEIEGGPGQIRAFRDPGWFRDPHDGREHLLIAASVARGDAYMGAVAMADA